MSSASKNEEFSETLTETQQGEKLIRRFLATRVQSIYKSWGMSDSQFYKCMGEYLNITPDGVRKFLHNRKSLHKDLLTYERLSDALGNIFNKYISSENIDSKQKEEAVETWMMNHDKCMKEIGNACTCLAAIAVYKVLDGINWDPLLNAQNNLYNATNTLSAFKLFINFLSGDWPGDSSLGLLPPQVEELKRGAKVFLSMWLKEKDVEGFLQELSQLILKLEI